MEQDSTEKKEKRTLAFNVVSKKEHKGFGAGSIDLNSVSCIIIDGDEAYIDVGAMHAKSKVEQRIKFSTDKETVPNGRRCWIVWVAVDRNESGSLYAGATACEMLIDTEARRGWKILADHVNRLDYAIKRRFMLEGLSTHERGLLKNLLVTHNEQWWENSPDELKQNLNQ
ncbi:hypothetical protein EBB07_20775 [Paenibacillaceae bacterium]|nr:hypothetical protein EBB07_20775 [Paenibacillaceae bacterium]